MARDYIKDSDEFELMGAYMSPVSAGYKKNGLAPFKHRVRMCEKAVADSDFIMVDSWEAQQITAQPTAVVMRHFDEELNGGDVGGVLCGGEILLFRIRILKYKQTFESDIV